MGYFSYSKDIDGIPAGGTCQKINTTDPNSKEFCSRSDLRSVVNLNPGHKLKDMAKQMYAYEFPISKQSNLLPSPPMNGFVQAHRNLKDEQLQDLMSSFSPESIPVIHKLAQEFAVFNRWFSSLPGETQPNRAFIHSGTSAGLDENYTIRRLLSGG